MKKKFFAVLTVVMFALGGCSENSVGENEALLDEGASGSVGAVTANDEVQSMAESMAQSMFESMTRGMGGSVTEAAAESTSAVTKKKETETTVTETVDMKQRLEEMKRTEFLFVRTSDDESKTLTVDSEIFPYDCEEIIINVDTEWPYFNDVEPYDCIDLDNLKYYPNLKRLEIVDRNGMPGRNFKIIGGDSVSGLEKLEEIRLQNVTWWEDDWLSGIESLRKLSINGCREFDGRFPGNLPQVEVLYIYMCPIDDLSFINEMSSLRELTVKLGVIGNSSFNGVEENYSLEKLTIGSNFLFDPENYNELTDIMGLSIFRRLKYLEIPGEYGEEEIEELQAMLPECEINYNYYLNGG